MGSDDDLPLVMNEIKTIMAARGTALTLHPENGEPPQLIYLDDTAQLDGGVIEQLVAEGDWGSAHTADARRWIECDRPGFCQDVLLIPITTVARHSRLLVSVYFDDLTPEQKSAADEIVRNRRPFAIGYFRLWQLARQQARQISALQTALNRTDMTVLLVDRSSQVVFANEAAQAMLADRSALRLRRGSLTAADQGDASRLRAVLEHVIEANASLRIGGAAESRAPLLSLDRAGLPPLIISVLPAAEAATEPGDIAAIVFALDPAGNSEAILEPICRVYNLTPVEARLACMLATGIALGEAAERMRVKEATARGYLKQIFAKTNTRRQSELLQLLLSSSIRIAQTIIAEPVSRD